MREYGDVNFIFGKTLRVLHETKSPKPVGNLLHIASRFTGPLLSRGRMDSLYFLRGECSPFRAVARAVFTVTSGLPIERTSSGKAGMSQ
jgi:hypothetical protein